MYLCNAGIKGGDSYKMVKYGDFHQLFALDCNGSDNIVRGKYKSGNKYQACGL